MIKILIPTDFSANAKNALKYALQLFKDTDCTFYLMHAYEDEIYSDEVLLNQETLSDVTKIVDNRSHVQLEQILKEAKKITTNPGHVFRLISTESKLIDESENIVDEMDIDLVIMGTKGRKQKQKMTFGSHTLQLLKYVDCPVLAIPDNYSFSAPKHVMFPTNFMIPYKTRELRLLSQILMPNHSEIEVIYVSNSDKLSSRQQKNKDLIFDTLSGNPLKLKILPDDAIIDVIFNYIIKYNVDMLVMVNTKHSFLENILFQSTIDELSLNINIPFLALQNMKRK